MATGGRVGLAMAAATLLAAAAAIAPHDTAAARTPVVFGYPYAAKCPVAGYADVVDRWHMYACNCTSYVTWALVANGQRIDWFVPGAMNAWNWPHVARLAGLTVDRRPAPGAVVVWPSIARPYGHVAYVTGVEPDGRIDVAEYNFPAFGKDTYVFDERGDVPTRGALFIHVPRRVSGR